MRSILSVILLGLTTSTAAHAGGVGVLAGAGLHNDRAYYYSPAGEQGIDSQMLPHTGVGVEGILGDRDNRILGVMRFYWLRDAPVSNPDVNQAFLHPEYSELSARDIGVATMGAQWGILGDPNGAQLAAHTLIGAGFLTNDSTEFLTLELGAAGTYTLAGNIQAFGNLTVNARYRKLVQWGPNLTAGVRYLFD